MFIYRFDGSGRFLTSFLEYLGDRRFFTRWQEIDPEKPVFRNHYCIANEDLSSVVEFYSYEFDDTRRSTRYVPSGSTLICGASGRHLFIGDSRDGYEIRVFDFSGKLVRKIRNVQLVYFEGQEFRAEPMGVRVRDDHLYCLSEKDSGYMTLTIYKMKWK
jgi:outer membrane protein assembly factor BamB